MKKRQQLYFIRHAESEANKNRILGSRKPFPLTEDGRADSRLIAAELAERCSIGRIISSPVLRAVQTAEAFSEIFGLEIEIDDRLAEQELGVFSGLSYDEVKNRRDYEHDSLKRWNWRPEGGESYADISERVISFFGDMEKAEEGSALVVTHAVTLRLITAALAATLPEYPKDFPNNGEILKVEFSRLGSPHKIESIMLGNSRSFTHNP